MGKSPLQSPINVAMCEFGNVGPLIADHSPTTRKATGIQVNKNREEIV